MNNKLVSILFFAFMSVFTSKGQTFAIKSNLLYDLTTTVNLGAEVATSELWTVELSANYNPWTFSNNKKWKHWLLQPEIKYWFCGKFNGSSIGGHLLGGQSNVGNIHLPFSLLGTDLRVFRNNRYESWFIGAGISYNYSYILTDRWSIEAGLGLGYMRFDYDRFDCSTCGLMNKSSITNYWGFTKLAVNIVYLIQ